MTDLDRLKNLAEKGWHISLTFSDDGWDFSEAYAGDCNCPHAKQYDPSDGHGYSSIDERDISYEDIPEWTPLSWWLDRIEPLINGIVPGSE